MPLYPDQDVNLIHKPKSPQNKRNMFIRHKQVTGPDCILQLGVRFELSQARQTTLESEVAWQPREPGNTHTPTLQDKIRQQSLEGHWACVLLALRSTPAGNSQKSQDGPTSSHTNKHKHVRTESKGTLKQFSRTRSILQSWDTFTVESREERFRGQGSTESPRH